MRRTDARAWMRLSGFLAALCSVALTGCGRAPTFSILGSFFPAWLACMVAGIVMAALVSWILTRYKLEDRLAWPALTYPCLAAFFSFTLWLLLFS
jgi:hypothetical protein